MDIKPVDIYKSDKVMRILGGEHLAVSLYKSGKKIATVSVNDSFDLSRIEANL